MRYVLSLAGNPKARALSREAIGKARAALSKPGDPITLAEGIAAEIPFEADDAQASRAAAARALEGLPLDVNALPADNRRKRLLVADMESTIITCECLDELADKVGLREKIAAITRRAMQGELDFAAALRARVALLKGLPATALDDVLRERVRLTEGAKALVATMRAQGALTVLVSGGFTYFAERVAQEAGFDRVQANTLIIENGTLAGRVAEPVLGREAKLAALQDTARALGIPARDALAVGDGANDLDMVRAAGLGVAFRAKPVLADAAAARIAHGDLTAVLYLQGYRADEIIRA
jgi:phosphoserine phosphatase